MKKQNSKKETLGDNYLKKGNDRGNLKNGINSNKKVIKYTLEEKQKMKKIIAQEKQNNYKISYSNTKVISSDDENSFDLSPLRKDVSDESDKYVNSLIKNVPELIDIRDNKIKTNSKVFSNNKTNDSDLSLIDLASQEDNSPVRDIIISDENPDNLKLNIAEKNEKEELYSKICDEIKKINNNKVKENIDDEIKKFSLLEMDYISFDKKENILEKNNDEVIPWLTDRTRQSTGILKLHNEILDFYKFMAPTKEEDNLKKQTVSYLKNLINECWPNWKVKTFGSFPNKLHLPDSDIDIVVISEDYSNTGQQLKMLKKIANKLLEDQKVDFLKIIEAKVPIIRATFKNTKINVDISANRKNGYAAKKVIKRILNCYPYIRPLLYILKYFLKQRKLNETFTGGISSFLLFNLLLSYIQVKQKEMLNDEDPDLSLGHLLCGFLQFYCFDFNYDNVGISVKHGGYFFKKSDRNWDDSNRPYLLCVENFQDPEQDIGKSCFKIKRVLDVFKSARDNLYYPSTYPIESYLKSFIQIDKFSIERLNYLKNIRR